MGSCYFRSFVPLFCINLILRETFIDGRDISADKLKIEPLPIKSRLFPSFVDIALDMNNKIRELLGAQAVKGNGIYVSVYQNIAFP